MNLSKIDFSCPNCLKAFSVAAHLAGKKAKCNSCGNSLTIPSLPIDDPFVDPFGDLSGFDHQASETPDAWDNSNSQCPQCQASMRSDAVICLSCGFDRRIGKQHATITGADVLDFPTPDALRVAILAGAVAATVFMLWTIGLDLLTKFDAQKLPTLLLLLWLIFVMLVFAWRCTLRYEVLRGSNRPSFLVISYLIGPFRFSRKLNLSEFDSVWFVQKPWGLYRQLFSLMQTINSLGMILIIRKFTGEPEQLNYRAELRGPRGNKRVIYTGNEKAKDTVNSIVRMLRDAAKLPLKNDIEMLK